MNVSSMAAPMWQTLPSMPEGNGNFICGISGKDIVIAGGISWREGAKIWRDSILRFDTTKRVWTELGRLPCGLAYASFGQVGHNVYVAGGGDGSNSLPAFAVLDENVKWHAVSKLSQGLVYSGCTVRAGKLYVICGAADAAKLGTVTDAFSSIELKTGNPESLSKYPSGALMLPAAAAVGDRIYSFTGARVIGDNQVQNVDAAHAYSVADKKWVKIKPFPIAVRGLAACALDERYILLGGGFKDDFLDNQFIYDAEKDVYLPAMPLPYAACANYLKVGDDLYWMGGEDKMKHRSALFYRCSVKALLSEALKGN